MTSASSTLLPEMYTNCAFENTHPDDGGAPAVDQWMGGTSSYRHILQSATGHAEVRGNLQGSLVNSELHTASPAVIRANLEKSQIYKTIYL